MYKIGDKVRIASFNYCANDCATYYSIKEGDANEILFKVSPLSIGSWPYRYGIKNWLNTEEILEV